STLSSQGEATGLPVEPRGTTDLTPRPTARPTDIGPPASLGIPQGASPRGSSSGSGGSVSGQTKIPSPNVPKPGGNAFSRPRDNGPASSGVANQNTPPLNSTPLGYPAGYRDPSADRDSIDNSRSNFGANASEPNFQHPDHTLGLPGDAALEGLQTPALVIEKRAPAQVQLGKTTLIQLIVKNVGGTKASDVKVVDRVPRGSKYVSAKPKPSMSGDQLTWDLGDVQPGDVVVIETSLVAEKTGELGSVAQVSFSSIATTRTLVTEPKLTITQSAPKFVMIDDEINLQIRIENVGTGAAENVTVETDISEQVAHPVGSELRYEVGSLDPGDYQDLTLTLNAKKPGKIQQRILVQ
ncbi:MAG: CARDB domain-containing protein, partial [Planctomycetota bacterium]|nr:CARDB domain-containing protein [Planctomycetota bacterium]